MTKMKKLIIAAWILLAVVLSLFALYLLHERRNRPLPPEIPPPTPPILISSLPDITPPPGQSDPPNLPVTLMPEGVFDFPSLHLHSAYDPFAVERNFWHDGTLRVTGTSEPFLMDETAVRIRGRGNSTWAAGQEKRPLRIRFTEPRTFLDSPNAARDWVLIANLFDASLIRTHIAFYLAGMLEGMPWSPFSRLVHVYINGDYKGIYQLADERNTEEGRADGDFLFEIDGSAPSRDRRLSQGETEGVDFVFVNGWVIDVRHPHRRDRDNHMAYLKDYLERVDDAIKTRDFAALEALVDIPSLIDFYLVQELFKNLDVGDRSIFLQIRGQGDARRIYFGPVWDFDRSAGNMVAWFTPEYIFAAYRNSWFVDLLDTPEFFALTAERWREINLAQIPHMLLYVQYLSDNYEEAFDRNFERHTHIFDVFNGIGSEPPWLVMIPPPIREIHTAKEQIQFLMSWLYQRAEWLDDFFAR
ncbi:MAG: CotH kinase family protein [Defluviitaleaceae bacterium]|nr:CotH kinase family protein [Defluviitaleaceae bacterium]